MQEPSELDQGAARADAEAEALYRIYCREYGLDPQDTASARDYEENYEWWVRDHSVARLGE